MNPKIKKIIFPILAVLIVSFAIFMFVRNAEAPGSTPVPPTGSGLPAIDPESIGVVVKDPATGKEFMSNQLIVRFQASVSEESALATIAKVGGNMISRFTNAPLFLIQVKDPGDGTGARKAMATLKGNADVESVELNYITTGLETPTAP